MNLQIFTNLASIILLVSARLAFAQSAPSATAPATPKEALVRLSNAMRDGDASAIIALIDAPDAPQAKAAGAMARFDGGVVELHRAAVAAFGEGKGAAVVGDSARASEASLAEIDAANVAVHGDSATVTFANAALPPAHLVRDHGQWKVQLSELATVDTPSAADAAAAEFDRLADAARRLAGDIRQRKFHSADKAAEEWRNRVMQAVTDTQPATQPAP